MDRHDQTIEVAGLKAGVRTFRGERSARSDIIDGFALVPGVLFQS